MPTFTNLRHLSLGPVGYTDLSFLTGLSPKLDSLSIHLNDAAWDYPCRKRVEDITGRLDGLQLVKVALFDTEPHLNVVESEACKALEAECKRVGVKFSRSPLKKIFG